MNTKLVIVGSVLIILMVLFGNNPVEEARKERELKYKGLDDPLMRAIQDYHEQNVFGGGVAGNGKLENGASSRSGSVVYPDYMMPSRNSRQAVNPYNPKNRAAARPNVRDMRMPTQDNSINNNNYYPPPRTGSTGGSQMQAPMGPRSDGHKMLSGGQRIAYNGTKVFFYNKAGRLKPLPDGRYTTVDGQELFIVGGEKTVASN